MTKIRLNLPKGYHPRTKKAMAEICKDLETRKVLHGIDKFALELLASNLNDLYKADEEMLSQPMTSTKASGNTEVNKLIKIKNDAQIQAVKIMQDFGLTPKSRERIKATQTDEKDEGGIVELARMRIDGRSKE